MSDQFAGFKSDSLLDQNSKLIVNTSFKVYTDQPCTILATLYTDRTKATPVDQATLLTDNLGMYEIYAAPGGYWMLVSGATVPRYFEVKEDISDTANTNEALLIANALAELSGTAATARTNLGLGSAATHASTDFDVVNAAANALDAAKAYTNSAIAASGGGGGGAGALAALNNLSDVASTSTSRTNLGLGTSATHDATDFDNAGAAASAYGLAQAYTNAAVAASGGGLQKASNLSDVASASTARTNLGLGTAATHAATDFDNSGAAASAYGLAQAFTNASLAVTGGVALLRTQNLIDVASVSTARTNLGLGTAATQPSSAFDNSGAAASAYGLAQAYVNSVVASSGNGAPFVISASGNTTAAAGNFIVLNTSTAGSGGYTVTLPTAAVGNGPIYVEQLGTLPANITGNIKGVGSTTVSIGVNGGVMMFVAASGTWRIGPGLMPFANIARLDIDNDFGGHTNKNYTDDEISYSSTTATVGTQIPWGSARQLTSGTGCVVTLPATAPKLGAWAVLGQGSGTQSTIQAASGGYIVGTGGRSSPIKTLDQNSRILVECIDATPGASGYIATGSML